VESAEGQVEGQRSNPPKDRERRQRDQAQKRGDYGAPDREGRVKRPYDKFSHSAAGHSHEGGREKKGGQGPRNWGTKDTAPEVPLDASADAEEDKIDETPAEHAEEGKAEEEVKEEAAEEEVKEVDFRTFLERKRKEEEESNQLIAVEIRKVDAIQDMKPLVKNEEDFFPIDSKKKSAKKAGQSSGNKVNVEEVLNVQAPRENRDDRRGGRGRGKQDRQRQQKRGPGGQGAQLSLHDDHDFPSLGVKA